MDPISFANEQDKNSKFKDPEDYDGDKFDKVDQVIEDEDEESFQMLNLIGNVDHKNFTPNSKKELENSKISDSETINPESPAEQNFVTDYLISNIEKLLKFDPQIIQNLANSSKPSDYPAQNPATLPSSESVALKQRLQNISDSDPSTQLSDSEVSQLARLLTNYKFKKPKNTSAYVKLIEDSQSRDEQLSIDSLIVELNSYSVGFKALSSP